MIVTDLLALDDVHLDLHAAGKAHLLSSLAGLAAKATDLDAGAIMAALVAREALGSTGVGRGLAMPHARMDGVRRAFVLIARLATPLRFEAIDDLPVDLVALVLLRPEPATDLAVLGCVARALRDTAVAERIRAARAPADVLDALAGAA